MYDYLETAVRQYLAGGIDRRALAMELSSFDWDDTSPVALQWRPIVGRLELLAHEVGEGFRDEAELRAAADEALTTMFGKYRLTITPGWMNETSALRISSGADHSTPDRGTLEIIAGQR